MKEFIEKILENLTTNGFPHKRVSLPTDKMFEAADKRGFSFNKVLEELKTLHNVDAEIGAEKIIFSRSNQEDMMKQAQDMMAKMDPAELKRLQDIFMNMGQAEKEEIMKKGKDLGLI